MVDLVDARRSADLLRPGAIALFFLFVAVLSAPLLAHAVIFVFGLVPRVVETDGFRETNPAYLLSKWAAVGSLALVSCFCGATASALFKERSDADLLYENPLRYLVYMTCFSFLTTFVFMALIVSNMLSGDLLPSLDAGHGDGPLAAIDFRMGLPGFGKIAIWFFVFGFFERIVPDTKRIVVENLDRRPKTGE